jgi:hypothetical protein
LFCSCALCLVRFLPPLCLQKFQTSIKPLLLSMLLNMITIPDVFLALDWICRRPVWMKGVEDRRCKRKQDLQVLAPFPVCLGRMINMFDLSNGVVATKMLTDKAHRDGTYFSCPPLFFAPCCYNFCMFSSIPGRTSTSAFSVCKVMLHTHTTHLCSVAFVCSFSCGERPE